MATNNSLNNSSAPFDVTSGNLTVSAGFLRLTNTSISSGIIQFGGNRFVHNYGTSNTFVGQSSGNLTLTVGSAIGNTSVGSLTLGALTTGASNCAFGLAALPSVTTGSNNICLGRNTGTLYTSSESNNICIGFNVNGTAAESNVIRLGNTGSHTSCYIAGINGVTVANPSIVTLNTSTGQLGNTTFVTGGTFTPVLDFGGGTTGITYSLQQGTYTRIGSIVAYSINITLTNKGSSTGAVSITGLPYTANTASYAASTNFSNLTFTGQVFSLVGASTSTASPLVAASGGAVANLLDSNFANNTTIRISGIYLV